MYNDLLFPLLPAYKDYIWGGSNLKTVWGKDSPYDCTAESWEVSAHSGGPSVVAAGPLKGRTLNEALTPDLLFTETSQFSHCFRGNLPVLIKFIDAAQNLSVQVHPGDAFARANENDLGKTEMWYICDAEKDAGIYCGFKRDTDAAEVRDAVEKNSLQGLLNFIRVKRGESYFIPAGTVHAIGAGITICEIQQNSNVTYRLYDYGRTGADGRPRPLHVEKGLAVASFTPFSPVLPKVLQSGAVTTRLLASCPYFTVWEYACADGCVPNINPDSYVAINFLEGTGTLCEYPYKKGSSFFVAAGARRVRVSGRCVFLMTQTI